MLDRLPLNSKEVHAPSVLPGLAKPRVYPHASPASASEEQHLSPHCVICRSREAKARQLERGCDAAPYVQRECHVYGVRVQCVRFEPPLSSR